METGIHVGNKQMSAGAKETADAINSILTYAHSTHTDQDTIRAALSAFSSVAEVKQVTIQNCTINGGGAPATATQPAPAEPTVDEDDADEEDVE